MRKSSTFRRVIAEAALLLTMAVLAISACALARAAQPGERAVVEFLGAHCPYCRAIEPDVQVLRSQGFPIEQKDILVPANQAKANAAGVTKIPTFVAMQFDGNAWKETGRAICLTKADLLKFLNQQQVTRRN